MKRNNSIDIFRCIAAILVVAIHTEPFVDQNLYVGFLVSQVITRIAVPFFFCISGYYFYCGLQNGKTSVKGTMCKYFKYYGFWTLIYYALDIVMILVRRGHHIDCLTYIKNFFIFGSVYHFWYFVAIIVSVFIFGVAYRLGIVKWIALSSIILYVIGVLCSAYYYLFDEIVLIERFHGFEYFLTIKRIFLTGLPFFCMGYFIDSFLEIEKTNKIIKRLVFSLVLFGVELLCVKILGLADNITITFGLYPLTICVVVLLLKVSFSELKNVAKICRGISSYVYCVHPMFMMILSCFGFYIHMNNFYKFSFILILCLTSWYLLKMLNKKWNSTIIRRYIIDN